jgi:peptide/nickel transport system substrate-binding protein
MRDTNFRSEDAGNANLPYIKTYLKGVDCPSQLTAVINLKQADPRFLKDRLASGDWDVITILPEHIWKGIDARVFKNLDLVKGYPVGTGPYRLVKADSQQMVYDRRDDWWGVKVGFQALPAPKRIIMEVLDSKKYVTLDEPLIDNTVDYGPDLTTENYLAALAKNAHLAAWNKDGPIYGVPTGCDFTLNINTATGRKLLPKRQMARPAQCFCHSPIM